jgi:hypothetical protein
LNKVCNKTKKVKTNKITTLKKSLVEFAFLFSIGFTEIVESNFLCRNPTSASGGLVNLSLLKNVNLIELEEYAFLRLSIEYNLMERSLKYSINLFWINMLVPIGILSLK